MNCLNSDSLWTCASRFNSESMSRTGRWLSGRNRFRRSISWRAASRSNGNALLVAGL